MGRTRRSQIRRRRDTKGSTHLKNKSVRSAIKRAKKDPPTAPAPKSDHLVGAELTKVALTPSLNAGLAIRHYSKGAGELKALDIAHELRAQMNNVSGGDLDRQEATLVAQSHTLDALFSYLLRMAAAAEIVPTMEAYMRLALKAQSQCRTTIETLSLMKNPPSAMFVKQANVANNQQINNGPPSSRAREIENQPNKLLEQTRGERLELGAKGTAIGADTSVETVGAVDRAEDNGR
jgi:hypothetical protein